MFRFSSIEEKLRAINKRIEHLMPIVTPSGVILGILLADILKPLDPLVTYLFAFLTLVNGMGVSLKDFREVARRPLPIAVFALSVYILIPSIVTLLSGIIFNGSDETIMGFILLYSIPTAVVACIWSGIYKGNAALSLTILVIGTLLAPIATPLSVRLLTSSDITIDTIGMMVSLLFMVVIPSAIGIIINMTTKGRCTEHVSPCLKPFTKLALVLVIMINTSQVAEELLASISLSVVPIFISAFVFTLIGFLISRLLSYLLHLSREDTVSAVFASGMKNISAAMVIAIDFFPPGAVLPIIFGIVLQQTTCAISAHFLFGKQPD